METQETATFITETLLKLTDLPNLTQTNSNPPVNQLLSDILRYTPVGLIELKYIFPVIGILVEYIWPSKLAYKNPLTK